MAKLKPCPCGEAPTGFNVSRVGGNIDGLYHFILSGDCCEVWGMEVALSHELTGEEFKQFCIKEWNEAPRGNLLWHVELIR
jgi:hypothetical protein